MMRTRVVLSFVILFVTCSFVPTSAREGFDRIGYNNPGLVVDLGVGLWAWPIPMDFDGDGDLDIVVGHSRSRCDPGAPNDCYTTTQVRLFENLLGQDGNFVQLKLEGGAGSNRAAIGARVTATAGGVTQTRVVGGGHGHYGAQDDLLVHFGLGAACEAEITVTWPDAARTEQRLTLPAGHRFSLAQGGAPALVKR